MQGRQPRVLELQSWGSDGDMRIRGEVLRWHQQVLHSLSWGIPRLSDCFLRRRGFLAYRMRNDCKWGM